MRRTEESATATPVRAAEQVANESHGYNGEVFLFAAEANETGRM